MHMKNLGYMLLVALLLCCTCVQCARRSTRLLRLSLKGTIRAATAAKKIRKVCPVIRRVLRSMSLRRNLRTARSAWASTPSSFQGESEPAVPVRSSPQRRSPTAISRHSPNRETVRRIWPSTGVSSAVRLRLACSSTGVWSDRSPCRRIGYGPQILTRISSPCGPLWGSCATEVSRRPGSIAWPTTTTVPMLSRPRSATTRRP